MTTGLLLDTGANTRQNGIVRTTMAGGLIDCAMKSQTLLESREGREESDFRKLSES